jgi:acetylornithine/succinyldiaminopimelate/putrescine aminotransferase
VLTGIGRTGRWFAYQHAGIDPDVVVTSKGLSGGIVPVAAVLMTERVHGSIYHSLETATAHSVTFEAHLLGMAAATAVLDVVESDGLLDRVAEVGERLRSAIADLRSSGSPLLGVRGRGLLLAFEVEGIDEPAMPDGAAVCMDLLMEHGVLVYPAAHAPTWLKLTPPLTLSDTAVDFFVAALRESLAELAE